MYMKNGKANTMTEGAKGRAGAHGRDMTHGSIAGQILLFSLPLMLGNVFQMFYNTVDAIVVGNFVGKEALAAVGSTTVIVNMAVFFFNGFAVGTGVWIGRYFGAKDAKRLHETVQTAMGMTFLFSACFTVLGVVGVGPMLRFMKTPEDVMADATQYLTIYFAGISGLLIYNSGSGILRAVGDSARPLYFLILTSLLNVGLDLLFVIRFAMGIRGVAWATVIAQAVSAVLVLILLTQSREMIRFSWRELAIRGAVLRDIFSVALPAGIQAVITSFSNIFVQSYVNAFGAACMAGWGSYNKLDSFIMMPMQSFAMAATTFVSQNIGAGQETRAHRGTWTTVGLALGVTGAIAAGLFAFAEPAVRLFSKDPDVVRFGALFLRTNTFFLLANCMNHVLAGTLRGRGDARGPMIIMLACFVGVRQLYLLIVTRFVANDPQLVGLGYPVGWVTCCIAEAIYYNRRGRRVR